jgi:formylglycine-generating enzyme required for sulfatase activity
MIKAMVAKKIFFILISLLATLLGYSQGRITPPSKQNKTIQSTTKVKPKISVSRTSISNGTRFTINGVSFDMINVAGGSFQMGSDDSEALSNEKPVHTETISTFQIGKTEVTQALWKAVMGSNPSQFKGDNRPVEQVSWDDCKSFISKLRLLTGKNFRFPTETEWEYAARGGNKSNGYKYSGSNNIDDVAWYAGNCYQYPAHHTVATKRPNELGIYDMTGNVMEWTSDFYSNDYSSNRDIYNHVRRGGGTRSGYIYSRISYRCKYTYNTTLKANDLGLRLAL